MKANRTWYVNYRLYKSASSPESATESFTFCPTERDMTDIGLELMADKNAVDFTHGYPYQIGENRDRVRLKKEDLYYDKQGKMVSYRRRDRRTRERTNNSI